jgi:hypothetical protein
MDPNETGGPAGAQDRPLGRGLEDVSHLFLSRKTAETPASDRAAIRLPERSPAPPAPRGGIALLRSASVTRDRLAAALMEFDAALEDGLRAFDAKIPCHPCGDIDVLAVDRASQLTIIDFEMTFDDGLLLRGIGHFDWIMRNMPNVQRMYREQAVNFSLPPRLFLVAPQFSPLLRRVARQITRPQIHCVRYHTVNASGGPGILFEPVVEE